MTREEVIFWNLVHEYVLPRFKYSVVDLRPDSGGYYSLKVKRLGESDEKTFTVFVDQLRSSVETGQLPEGLLCSFADDLS